MVGLFPPQWCTRPSEKDPARCGGLNTEGDHPTGNNVSESSALMGWSVLGTRNYERSPDVQTGISE